MVVAGVRLTGAPLVTEIAPGLMTPLPYENTEVREVEVPAVIVVAPAVKLAITGAGTIVTVVCAVTKVPAAFVTVSV